MSIDGTISASISLNDRRTVGLNPSAVNIAAIANPATTFVDGTGAAAANLLFPKSYTLSGTTQNIDLAGVVTDPFGSTVTNARVKALYIKNTGNANIVVGNGTNPWATLLSSTGTFTLPPGAWAIFCTPDATGWAVTASTGDILLVTGTSGQTFDICVLGANA